MTATRERPVAALPPQEDVERATRHERRKRRRKQATGQALLFPAALWLTLFLIVPLIVIVVWSFFGTRDGFGDVVIGSPTLKNYSTVFTGEYVTDFLRSVWFSLLVVIATLALGYPLAYFIVRHGGKRQPLWLLLVMIPFWTSYLARMYAWRTLLNNDGLVNQVLGVFGWEPDWIGSPVAVVLVLAYSFLPFMILPLYISVERMDFRLVEASYDLGAGKVSTFFRVTVRQTLPGIIGGSMLVFIPCVGDFATAEIMGGGNNPGTGGFISGTNMIGQRVQGLFQKTGNAPLGSAISMLLMLVIVVGMLLYVRSVGRDEAGF